MTSTETGKKSTGNGRRSSGRSTKSKTTTQKKGSISVGQEVTVIVMLAVSLFLFLSNFHLTGVVGKWCLSFTFGLFGVVGYIIPLVLFFLVCFYIANHGSLLIRIKIIGAVFITLAICGLSQLMALGSVMPDWGIGDYYAYATALSVGRGGGILGGLMVMAFGPFLDLVGTYVLLFVFLLIGLVLLTEKSFVHLLERSGQKVQKTAREEQVRFRERQEERKAIRQDLQTERAALRAAREQEKAARTKEKNQETPRQTETKVRTVKNRPSSGHAVAESYPDIPAFSSLEDVPDYGEDWQNIPSIQTHTPYQEESVDFPASPVPEKGGSLIRQAKALLENQKQARQSVGTDEIPVTSDGELPSSGSSNFPEEAHASGEFLPLPHAGEHNLPDNPYDHTDEDGVRTVVTSTGKVLTWDLDGIPGARPVAKSVASEGTDRESGPGLSDGLNVPVSEAPLVIQREYVFPPITLLKKGNLTGRRNKDAELRETARKLQQTLANFGVGVTVTNISCGPAVTRYELQPEQGVTVSKIVRLTDDIKLNLAAADIRIEAPIPGKAAVGIEVPNTDNTPVMLRDLIESPEFKNNPSSLAFATGKDIAGQNIIADIGKMPHLLIAGATGSGKSVCINTIIVSLLYKSKPEDVKLIMIDPKVVELSVYNGIPHLLIPVVTDPKKAAGALNWAVNEMTDRYKKFAEYNVRDLKGYNEKIMEPTRIIREEKPEKLPQIVIIVDELADLMMVAPGEVEDAICRLAQMARAAGLHLVIATQRPSVNVITGLIKANVPSRIAFSVSSGVDSRTILDMNGAEKLLGKGDMLFYPVGYQKPVRVQGAFVSDKEVSSIVEFLSSQTNVKGGEQAAEDTIVAISQDNSSGSSTAADEPAQDPLFADAGRCIIEKDKASIGMLQRVFRIGFNRAARIMDQLAEAGVVGEEEGTKPRTIQMSISEFEAFLSNQNK